MPFLKKAPRQDLVTVPPDSGGSAPGGRFPEHLRRYSSGIALVLTLLILWNGLPKVYDSYTSPQGTGGDLGYLLDAATLVVTPGESKTLYGPDPVDQVAYRERWGHEYPKVYPYAPAFAYAMSPFTLASRPTAIDLWRVGVAICTAVLAFLVASSFRSWAWRIAIVAAIVCWEPILLNVRIGQAGALVAMATAGSVAVYLRSRNTGAALMGLLAVKPTAAIGPALMVFAEGGRSWMVFLVSAIAVVMTPFVYLGVGSFMDWMHILSTRGSVDLGGAMRYNQGLNSLLGRTEVVSILLFGLLVAGVLVTERVRQGLGLCVGAAFAVVASLLLNPHAFIYDWGVAFVIIMLLRRSRLRDETTMDLVVGLLGVSLFVAGQIAWSMTFHDLVVRPLTGWALVVAASLALLAFFGPLRRALHLPENSTAV